MSSGEVKAPTTEESEANAKAHLALLEKNFWMYGRDSDKLFHLRHYNRVRPGQLRVQGEILTNWAVSEPSILYPGQDVEHTFRAIFREYSHHPFSDDIKYEFQKLLRCWVCGESDWVPVSRLAKTIDPFTGWAESSLGFLQGAYFCPSHSFYTAHYDERLRMAVRCSMQQLASLPDVEVQREILELVYGSPLPDSTLPS